MAGWSTPGPNDLEQNPASPLFSDSLRERVRSFTLVLNASDVAYDDTDI
jgi:hypothetical protein